MKRIFVSNSETSESWNKKNDKIHNCNIIYTINFFLCPAKEFYVKKKKHFLKKFVRWYRHYFLIFFLFKVFKGVYIDSLLFFFSAQKIYRWYSKKRIKFNVTTTINYELVLRKYETPRGVTRIPLCEKHRGVLTDKYEEIKVYKSVLKFPFKTFFFKLIQ